MISGLAEQVLFTLTEAVRRTPSAGIEFAVVDVRGGLDVTHPGLPGGHMLVGDQSFGELVREGLLVATDFVDGRLNYRLTHPPSEASSSGRTEEDGAAGLPVAALLIGLVFGIFVVAAIILVIATSGH